MVSVAQGNKIFILTPFLDRMTYMGLTLISINFSSIIRKDQIRRSENDVKCYKP